MSEEILINVTPVETRVALVENGMLQEAYIERASRKGIVGNIYKGKVVRVLPGMEAAFVDIGLERAAFIHASDVVSSQASAVVPGDGPKPVPDIRTLLREGQSLVVQVTKDPIGTKGARLTTQLSIPSRYLVFMPDVHHIGISQRIEDEEERARLKGILEEAIRKQDDCAGGFIIRTAAEGVCEEDLLADMAYLQRLSQSIKDRIEHVKAPSVI